MSASPRTAGQGFWARVGDKAASELGAWTGRIVGIYVGWLIVIQFFDESALIASLARLVTAIARLLENAST